MKSPKQMSAPKFFSQGAHPVRNLGQFAHPPAQSAHRTTKVGKPRSGGLNVGEDVPDFTPRPKLKQNKRFDIATPVNQQSMDASDNKSESYPSAFGADNAGTKRVTGGKPVKRKLKSGLDLFGKL